MMGDSERFENVRLLLVDLEGGISGLSRYGRRGLPGSIGLAISGVCITGAYFWFLAHTLKHISVPWEETIGDAQA
jgi:hypothetical protein